MVGSLVGSVAGEVEGSLVGCVTGTTGAGRMTGATGAGAVAGGGVMSAGAVVGAGTVAGSVVASVVGPVEGPVAGWAFSAHGWANAGVLAGGAATVWSAGFGCMHPVPARREVTIAEEIKESRFICRSRIPSALLW